MWMYIFIYTDYLRKTSSIAYPSVLYYVQVVRTLDFQTVCCFEALLGQLNSDRVPHPALIAPIQT